MLLSMLMMLVLTPAASAQQQPAVFEAASVKPSKLVATGGQRGSQGVRGGVVEFDNHRLVSNSVTLYTLVKWAYGLMAGSCAFSECDYLTGGPAWIRSDEFDVQAVMPETAPTYTFTQFLGRRAPLLQSMLQNLLADRFKLELHREMKEMPVYLLTVAKDGPKLTPSKSDDKRYVQVSGNPALPASDRVMIGRKATMSDLVDLLQATRITDRTVVVDRTGIQGEFNFDVKFAPIDNNAFGNTSSPSIFTALQEQLGLKLEAGKAPVEFLVIDHAERPTEN
jgi:uncharacterized protein (TIGR03435 family)